MERKKNPNQRLSKNKSLLILFGLNVPLAITLFLFINVNQKQISNEIAEDVPEIYYQYEDEVTEYVSLEDIKTPETPIQPEPKVEVPTQVIDAPNPEPKNDSEESTQPLIQPNPNTNHSVFEGIKKPTTIPTIKKPSGEGLPVEKGRTKAVDARKTHFMAIYPGCEKYRPYKKAKTIEEKRDALINCFSEKLHQDFIREINIEKLNEIGVQNDLDKLKTQLRFILDENGNITQVKAAHGNKILEPEAVRALKKVNKRIQQKGGIKPAEFKDGEKARVKFKFPVAFSTER